LPGNIICLYQFAHIARPSPPRHYSAVADPTAAAVAAGMPTYPAMSQEEVEEWLEHIPVFAVTDEQGQGVVLRPDDDTSVFYFFMSPLMANATLNQLKESSQAESMDLRVSAFSLGKIWFNILNAGDDKEVLVSTCIHVNMKCRLIHRFKILSSHTPSRFDIHSSRPLVVRRAPHPATSSTDLFLTRVTCWVLACFSP
jgi:hypothetical protein